jgi:hypothetical protein
MADELYGVYAPEDDGHPLAVFRDGDQAQAFRKQQPNADRLVVTAAHGTLTRHADVAAQFAAVAPATATAEPGATGDPHAGLRAEIRMRLEREALEKDLEREVRAEMATERKGVEPAK